MLDDLRGSAPEIGLPLAITSPAAVDVRIALIILGVLLQCADPASHWPPRSMRSPFVAPCTSNAPTAQD